MIRIVLGVIAGFIAWSIIWVGSDYVLMTTFAWYARHQAAFSAAITNKEAFEPSTTILIMNLVRSVIASFLVGFLTAFIAGENRRSTLILGVVLLVVGILVELVAWHYLPVWYHFIFLFLLVPVTMAGGKLKKFNN
ncbi:MAG: hypothetical protein ACRD43_00055 [Pyrinomonadaceae bacterium]